MKRRREAVVEMTPLLDVVFILLFALMLNVNVSKAKDDAEIDDLEVQVAMLEASESSLMESLDEVTSSRLSYVEKLKAAQSENSTLDKLSKEQLLKLSEQTQQFEEFDDLFMELITKEIESFDGEIDTEFIEAIADEGLVIKEWLKYEQIGERYLFAEVSISNTDGRVYIDDTYTGVNIERRDAINNEVKKEKINELSGFIYNWLDHKEGGYSFIFITVVAESKVTRSATEIIYDTLGSMQPSFDQNQYLINKYIAFK